MKTGEMKDRGDRGMEWEDVTGFKIYCGKGCKILIEKVKLRQIMKGYKRG